VQTFRPPASDKGRLRPAAKPMFTAMPVFKRDGQGVDAQVREPRRPARATW
jgi:hypothetical protein